MILRVAWMIAAVATAAVLCGAPRPADTAGIAKVRAEWASTLHDKKLDEFVALYTPDGQFLTETGERFAGREAIRGVTRQAMTLFTGELTFESQVTEISGDLAYDSGDYRETLVSAKDGKVLHPHGAYLMVLKREHDGDWRIAVQMWTNAAGADAPQLH